MTALLIALALLASGCAQGGPSRQVRPFSPAGDGTAVPAATSPESLETAMVEDVEYVPGKSLSVIAPVEQGPWTTVVAFHGIGGTPELMYPLAEAIAQRGIVVFIPDWGAPPPWDHDAAGVTRGWEKAAAAMRYARAHTSEYGSQAQRLVAVGHSWGASVSMGMAFAGDDFSALGAESEQSALPDAVVALDGPMDTRVLVDDTAYADDPTAWDRMNPTKIAKRLGRLGEGVEYRLIIGGTWPESDASNAVFERQLRDSGGSVTLQTLNKSHMEMVEPLPETVETILELASE
jgi:dienelactone hydrolase